MTTSQTEPPLTKIIELVKKEAGDLEAKVQGEHRSLVIAEARRFLGKGSALCIQTAKDNLSVSERLLAHKRRVLEGLEIVQGMGEFPNVP